MNSRFLIALGLLGLIAAGPSPAATIYVSTRNGAEKGNGASWATAYRALAPALHAAKPGDEVWVAAGVYPGNFVLRSGIRLYGGFHGDETRRFDRDWRQHDTFLDGREHAPVVTIEGGETPYRTVLDGFTIQDGQGLVKDGRSIGGGVLVRGAVRALIAHNTIRNNTVRGRVNVAGPQVADGGGIGLIDGASAVIKDNLILRNTAIRNGGGIAVWDVSDASISNNTILHNTAKDGGGMAFETTDVRLLNNLVASNSSGLYYDGPGENGPEVTYHLLHANDAYEHQGWTANLRFEGNNVFKDPLFADTRNDNYRLARNTPCRDAGADICVEAGDEDYYGMPRIRTLCVDIGASEARPIGANVVRKADGERTEDPPLDLSVVYVNKDHIDASDDNSGTSRNKPKKTILAGIDAVKLNGGEVRVAACDYGENIFLPRGVRLRNLPPEGQEESGQGAMPRLGDYAGVTKVRSAVIMLSVDSTLEGFWLKGGPAVACPEGPSTVKNCIMAESPAAALRSDGGSPKVLGCLFTANMPAMELKDGAPEVRGCRFQGNAGEEAAGAIVLEGGEAVITDNVFAGNVGGAISMHKTMARVLNNTFYGNHGYARFVSRMGDVGVTAGAVESVRSALTFVNNIVAGNTGGVQNRDTLAGFPVVRNNCVFQNSGFDWRLEHLSDPTGSNGNIRVDPQMVAPQHGRFQLMLASPCRNMGDSTVRVRGETDVDGQTRRQGREVDIGADENETHIYGQRYKVVRVTPDGNDHNDGATWARPVRSIRQAQEALALVGDSGGEIWVAKGQYREPVLLEGYAALYGGFSGREERRDQRDPDKNLTELLGNHQYPPVVFLPGASFNVVDGFTIRNGFGTAYTLQTSGGLVCHPGTTSVVANNIIIDNVAEYGHALGANHAWVSLTHNTIANNGVAPVDDGIGNLQYGTESPRKWSGAAVLFNHSIGVVAQNSISSNSATGLCFLDRSGFLVRDNEITANAGSAGGIDSWNCVGEIANNVIASNRAHKSGGGLALESSMEYIHDNLVVGNTSKDIGGGIYSLAGNPLLVNNTVVRNTARDAGAAYLHNAGMLYNNIFAFNSSGLATDSILTGRLEPTLVMRLNCVFGNTGYETRGVPQNAYVTDNFSEDPDFVGAPGEGYRLDRRSPCLDRGTDSFLAATDRDIDGEPRLIGLAVDIGADERPDAPGVVPVRPVRVPSRPVLSASGQRIPGGPGRPGVQQRTGAQIRTPGRLR